MQKLASEKPVERRHQLTNRKMYNQSKQFEMPDNLMKLNDIDIDELLECAEDDIENSAFFASSVQVMGIFDSMICAIDDRLSKKKSRIISTKNNGGVGMDSHMLTPKVAC